jgi:hypothetical protein
MTPGLGSSGLASLGLSAECLKALETRRPNLLLIGSSTKVSDLLQLIEPSMAHPVVSLRADRLRLPERLIGTLVLHDANRLSPAQQEEWRRWVDLHPQKQVIATASEPLFPLMVRNAFSSVLFFQLNFMSLMIDGTSAAVV